MHKNDQPPIIQNQWDPCTSFSPTRHCQVALFFLCGAKWPTDQYQFPCSSPYKILKAPPLWFLCFQCSAALQLPVFQAPAVQLSTPLQRRALLCSLESQLNTLPPAWATAPPPLHSHSPTLHDTQGEPQCVENVENQNDWWCIINNCIEQCHFQFLHSISQGLIKCFIGEVPVCSLFCFITASTLICSQIFVDLLAHMLYPAQQVIPHHWTNGEAVWITSSGRNRASFFITGSFMWSLTSTSASLTAATWYLRGYTLLTLLFHLVSDHIFNMMSTCFLRMTHHWL